MAVALAAYEAACPVCPWRLPLLYIRTPSLAESAFLHCISFHYGVLEHATILLIYITITFTIIIITSRRCTEGSTRSSER